MDLNEYQRRAATFDQVPDGPDRLVVPLLGLAGETGELLSEYKRDLRAQRAHEKYPNVESIPTQAFQEVVKEEVGDILWYASNVATKFNVALDDIAEANLAKLADRYRTRDEHAKFFDDDFQQEEQIPRQFEVLFAEIPGASRAKSIAIRADGKVLGNELTDNSHVEDGYRFHDAFHLSYATMLGWSPVTRKFMRVKRSTDKTTDEVEDGGRSWVFEEVISLMTFEFARRHNFFANYTTIDGRLLRDIKNLTAGIEVRMRSRREWELAILEGFKVWRQLRDNGGGWVHCDLRYRAMKYRKATSRELEDMMAKAADYTERERAEKAAAKAQITLPLA